MFHICVSALINQIVHCLHFLKVCGGETTGAPEKYTYSFDDTYNFSEYQLLSDTIQITKSFEVSFRIKTDAMNASIDSILSIVNDADIDILTLSLIYIEEDDFVQILYENENKAFVTVGIIPNDDNIHEVQLILNEYNRNIFKVDGDRYYDDITGDSFSFNASTYDNNLNFSLFVGGSGEEQSAHTGFITDIEIKINMVSYFNHNDDAASDSICLSRISSLEINDRVYLESFGLIASYLNDSIFVFNAHQNGDIIYEFDMFSNINGSVNIIRHPLQTPISAAKSTQIGKNWYIHAYAIGLVSIDLTDYTLTDMKPDINVDGSPCLCNNGTHLWLQGSHSVWTYDISTGNSSNFTFTKEELPIVEDAACEIYQNVMYIFGGRDERQAYNTTYAYNTTSNSLHLLMNATLSTASYRITTIQQNEFIFLMASFQTNDFPVHIFNANKKELFVSTAEGFLSQASVGLYHAERNMKMFIDKTSIYQYRDDAAYFDFNVMSNQTVTPGDKFLIFYNISRCSNVAIAFTIKSQIAEIGINHKILIEDGVCKNIEDLYGVPSACDAGITPIITKDSNTSDFVIDISSDNDKLYFAETSITLKVSECPVGEGIDDNAILLDCNQCQVNTFKIIEGNTACYECGDQQDGFSCEGSSVINIEHNLWITAFDKESEKFISPFDILQNHSLFATQCPVKYTCIHSKSFFFENHG